VRLGRILKRLLAFVGVPLLAIPLPVSAQLIGIPQVVVPLPETGPVADPGPVGVLERLRPGYLQPQGLQFGGTQILPALTLGTNYDSNIYAAPSNPTGDEVFHIRPELTLDSGPRQLAYRFTGYGDFVEYATNTQLNNPNAGALLGIRGDYTPSVVVESLTGFVYGHQDPASFSSPVPNTTLPFLPQYTQLSESLTARHDVGDLGGALTGTFLRSTYQDVTINGVLFNQTQFNGNTYSISPQLSYLVAPPSRLYVQAFFARNAYDTGSLDSDTYTTVVGSTFEIRRLIRGNAYVGYKERVYDSGTIGSYGAFTYGIDAAWYPMEVLTVKLSGKQDFSDSAFVGTNGVVGTSPLSIVNVQTVQGQIDYEVAEQVILSAVAGYENDNYLNTSRVDGITKVGADLRYLVRAGASLDLLYLYSTRQSNVVGFSYDRQQVGIALRLQY
jgi:hypothetical protein